MPAPKKNRYAAKPPGEAMDARTAFRCKAADLKRWKRAAKRAGHAHLGPWVNETLNAASNPQRKR